MDRAEAVRECERWFAYLESQQEKARTLQKAATLARQGHNENDPEKMAEARRIKNSVDRQPKVYDGARLEQAVQFLIKDNRKLVNAIKAEEHSCWEGNRTMSPHLRKLL